MIKRPKLNELRLDDSELRNEINQVGKRVNKESWFVFVAWIVCVVIYYLGYRNNFYGNELFFLLGFPLFCILGGIGLVWIQIFQKAQFDITTSEYDSRQILHRLEEIHETLIEIKGTKIKDKQ